MQQHIWMTKSTKVLKGQKQRQGKEQEFIRQQLSTTTTRQRKTIYQKQRKRTGIIRYYCGRPSHTSDKCWWKAPTYNIDQPQPVWSLPNDTGTQQRIISLNYSTATNCHPSGSI
eukprot:3397815-Amphidinium_carterae.3